MTKEFRNDEQGYLTCVQDNPNGLVMNAHKNPKEGYLVLHQACCSSISQRSKRSKSDGGFTERQFVKIVSSDEAGLKDWLREKGFSNFSTICSQCCKNRTYE